MEMYEKYYLIYEIKLDWTDGTFLFASTTCFDPDLMKNLSKKAADLKEGSYFITVTKTLEP